jgi:hypothetical protein
MAVIVYRKNEAGDIEQHRVPPERLQALLSAGYTVNKADLEDRGSAESAEPLFDKGEYVPEVGYEPSLDEKLETLSMSALLDSLTHDDLSQLDNSWIRGLAEEAGIEKADTAKIKTLKDKLSELIDED